MPFMGRPQTWEEAAAYVADVARDKGYDEEQVKALLAVMRTEGGWRGAAGDTSGKGAQGAGSYSAWQLNFHPGNPGTRFARAMGMSNDEAKRYLSENPLASTEWWLDINNDLGKAVHQGRAQGLTGPALATYAQRHGQRSVSPETAGGNYSALFGRGQPVPSGGGAHLMSQEGGSRVVSDVGAGYVADEAEELTGSLTPERIAQLVAQHGQYTATEKPGTERRKRVIRGVETDLTEKNPDPTWIVVFADGQKIEVKGERDEEGAATGNWLPVAGSAALKAPTTKTPAGAPSTGLWVDLGDGRRIRMQQGEGGALTPAADASGNPIVDFGGRAPPRDRTAAQESASQAQAVLAWARAAQVGKPTPLDPITAGLRQAQAQRAGTQSLADLASVEQRMAAAGAQGALQGKYEAQTVTELRKLVPKQMLAIQEALATIESVRDRMAQGQMTEEEANATIQSVKNYMAAGLRGTTPAEEEKLRQQEATKRAELGQSILNQRVQSGSALAGNLFRDYRELLMAAGGHTEPGFRAQFNPLEAAVELQNALGGGPEMGELAQVLLQSVNPNAQQNQPMFGQGAAIPASQPAVIGAAQGDLTQQYADLLNGLSAGTGVEEEEDEEEEEDF